MGNTVAWCPANLRLGLGADDDDDDEAGKLAVNTGMLTRWLSEGTGHVASGMRARSRDGDLDAILSKLHGVRQHVEVRPASRKFSRARDGRVAPLAPPRSAGPRGVASGVGRAERLAHVRKC